MKNLAGVMANLTDAQAVAVWHALAQWADNERNGIEEGAHEGDPSEATVVARCEAVEGVVERLNAVIAGLAEVRS